MARVAKKLTARAAETRKPGRYGDGAGLYLVVAPSGARKWVYRFTWQGKVTEAGLGSADGVTLAEARGKAHEARKLLEAGWNPIEAKRRAAIIDAGKPTFGKIADALVAAKESEWRNPKHRAQWRMTLETYAAPLWSRPVDEIDTTAVLAVLTPLWQARPETASRLRGRIEAVLDAARVAGHTPSNEPNPARWRGHLAHLLPKRGKLTRGHHAAMAYADVPAFVAKLREREALAALALEFTILTSARSGEVYGARWGEVDLASKVWIIPPDRMKAAREHRIPLSERALAILEELSEARTGDFVFPGQRPGRPLSGWAMAELLRRMGQDAVTVHGFRSAFRDWAGNETHYPRELAEAALAHVVGDKAEQAYRRGDALEKRRELMAAWASYCEPGKRANVLALRRVAGAARGENEGKNDG
jgi:integrase